MFCTNCGAQIPDYSRFCPSCGHPVSRVPQGPAPALAPQPPERKGHAGLIVGVVVACVAVLAIVAFGIGELAKDAADDEPSPATVISGFGGDGSDGGYGSDTSEDTNDFDDMGEGADAEGFAADSSGSYAVSDAPVEGENVTRLGDAIYYISPGEDAILSRPRAGGDESTVYEVDDDGSYQLIDELASDGEHLYVVQIDYDDGGVNVLQLGADGSVQAIVLAAVDMDDILTTQLYVTKNRIGFVALEYDESSDLIDSQHLYFADKDGENPGNYALSYSAEGYCMSDDAFWYVTSSYVGLDYQTDLHRIDLDSGSDESVYRTTSSEKPYGAYAGDDCVYLAFRKDSGVRVFAIDEDGLQGGIDLTFPDLDGAFSDDFLVFSIYADRHSGHIIVSGSYPKGDGTYVCATFASNMDGSSLTKVLDRPFDPTESGNYTVVGATPCGSDVAVSVNSSTLRQDYVIGADGQNAVLYHEWREDASSDSDQGAHEDMGDALST